MQLKKWIPCRNDRVCCCCIRCCCLPCICTLRFLRVLARCFHRHVKVAYVVILVTCVLFWGEFYVYWNAASDWYPQIEKHDIEHANSSNTLRFLLVGDPQLIGELHENPLFGIINRWDSDRYLLKTFSRAFDIAQPDIVIFVGDLLDEGGVASNISLARYARRFENIFQPQRYKSGDKKVEFVAYWGDNDLQDWDILFPERFNFYRQRVAMLAVALGLDVVDMAQCRPFRDGQVVMRHYDPLLTDSSDVYDQGCPDETHFRPAQLIVDQLPSLRSELVNKVASERSQKKPAIRMLVSHYPLIGPWSIVPETDLSVFAALRLYAPHLVIGAHTHISTVMWCWNCLNAGDDRFVPRAGQRVIKPGDEPFQVVLPHPRTGDAAQPHIIIPTASYRMGVTAMGYGVITLDITEHTLTFSVMWNPRRYVVLFVYLVVMIFVAARALAAGYVAWENGKCATVYNDMPCSPTKRHII